MRKQGNKMAPKILKPSKQDLMGTDEEETRGQMAEIYEGIKEETNRSIKFSANTKMM